jgi:hypothetical protein
VFDDKVQIENKSISFGALADKCCGGVRVYSTKKTFVLDVGE